MILLLHGADAFRSRQKLKRIEEAFLSRPGAEANFLKLRGGEFELSYFSEAVLAMPFLAGSRLVVVEGALTGKSKDLEKLVEHLGEVPESTVVVFYESEPVDEKLKPIQKLLQLAKREKFEPLQGKKLTDWIKKRAVELGGETPPLVAEMLARIVGPDLWRMEQELQKLVAYAPEVTAEAVEELIHTEEAGDIFALVDAIGGKKARQALQLSHALRADSQNEIYILSMITRQIRNILLVKSLLGEGKSEREIASKLHLHPFVTKKAIEQARHFDMAALRRAYERLVEADVRLKNSGSEAAVTLDLLIAELCQV